jgi:uracil-DNA glycosylase family 4
MTKPPSCETCPLYKAPGPITGQGNYNEAKLIVITDAPSLQDAKVGLPFSDGAGNVFNRILYEAGIKRSEVLIIPQVRCYGQHTQDAITACSRFITRDLERSKSDTVLLLGDTVFKQFIGSYSTLDARYHPPANVYTRKGCVEQRDGRKWIGTIHPRDYMRNVSIRDEIVEHFRKARSISGVSLPLPTVHESVTDSDVVKSVEFIRTKIGSFSDDVETHQHHTGEEDDYVGGDYEVDLGGISVGEWTAMVLDPQQLHLLTPLFTDPSLWRFEHNGMYDQYHFAKILGADTLYKGGISIYPHNKWMDGMLAAHYHRSYKFKYLKPDCLSRYTRLPYYDRKLERISRRLYNGMDVIATHQECVRLRQLGIAEGWWDTFQNIGMKVLPILEEQRIKGVKVDVNKAYFFRRMFEIKLAKVEELAKALVPVDVDPFNPHHQKELFYTLWKLPKQYGKREKKDENGIKRKIQTLSTDFEARKRLALIIAKLKPSKRKDELAPAAKLLDLIDYRSGEKKKLEYLDRIDPDMRIHAFYKAHGQESFRLSSTPNLQNFPVHEVGDFGGANKDSKGLADPLGFERKEYGSLRSLVVPDHEDDLILSIDFNQIQLWIYTCISGSKWLKAIYDSGDYIYGIVYDKLFKEPFFKDGMPRIKDNMRSDVPDNRLKRAKAVPLGFLFGRSAEAVALEYGWELAEGVTLRKWWFDNNPELLKSYSATELEVQQKGYCQQAYGVRMYYPDGKVTEAINGKAQCGEAFVVQESLVLINDEFKKRGWTNTRTMLSVHDSLVFNIAGARTNPSHLVDVYENIVLPICTRPIPQYDGFRFRIEGTVGTMWDYKTQKYPKWKASLQREEANLATRLSSESLTSASVARTQEA